MENEEQPMYICHIFPFNQFKCFLGERYPFDYSLPVPRAEEEEEKTSEKRVTDEEHIE